MLTLDCKWGESFMLVGATGDVLGTVTIHRRTRGNRNGGADVVIEGKKENLKIVRVERWKDGERQPA